VNQLVTVLLYVVGIGGMFLLLIAPHEGGHFLFAKLFKVRVIEFSVGAGTKLWSTTRGGTLYALRAIPILGYVRMGGMEPDDLDDANGFHSKPAWQRIVILVGGPAANFVVAMLLITGFLLTQVNTDPGYVFAVAPGSAAAVAGMKTGDSIRTVNGKPFNHAGLLQKEEQASPGASVAFTGIHANGQPFTYTITPKPNANGRYIVGLSLPIELLSAQTAITDGITFPFVTIGGTIQGIGSFVTGKVPGGLLGPQGITGPVGLADIAAQSVSQGPPAYISVVALLSVALGFTNLLPLLALDGGRIVVVVIEWLRRRPFDRNSELNFQRWGLVALLGLVVVITFLDIQRIVTGQFPKLH
jgi:regulator of sigma E protease